MKRKILVERHLSHVEIERLIREEREKRFLERLIFIRDLYEGESVEKAARKLGRVKQTGYNWLERWNARSLEGLRLDFKKAGRPLSYQLRRGGNWRRYSGGGMTGQLRR